MEHILTIPGQLPGLNEYIAAERSSGGKYRAAAMKRNAERVIGLCARSHLGGIHFTGPVTMTYTWHEANLRRDKDSIAFARKLSRIGPRNRGSHDIAATKVQLAIIHLPGHEGDSPTVNRQQVSF